MTLNRQQRRELAKGTRRIGKKTGNVVQLQGGPMSGWTVDRNAPCLEPDWWDGMPKHLQPPKKGRYVITTPGEATWRLVRGGKRIKDEGQPST